MTVPSDTSRSPTGHTMLAVDGGLASAMKRELCSIWIAEAS
jgi:hypothetical protein